MDISEPTVEGRQLTTAECRAKLRQKLKNFKNHQPANRQPINEKEYNKMMREAKLKIQKLQNDERVTPKMIDLYKRTCNEFTGTTIPTPIEMLDNVDETRINLREYFQTLIENCKKNNVSREKFIADYLNSVYTKYHVEVLGIDVIPERLRCDLIP